MAEDKEFQFAEDDDVARARAFWKENGKSIVVGVLLGLSGIAVYNYGQSYQQTQGEDASTLYEQMKSEKEGVDTKSIADQLKADFQSTAYADLAAFAMAKHFVEDNNLESATQELDWIMNNSKNEGFQHISRLRLISVLLAQQNPDRALDLSGNANKRSFESHYQELMGDAFILRGLEGDNELARNAYQQSLLTLPTGVSHARLIQLKLDNAANNNIGNN